VNTSHRNEKLTIDHINCLFDRETLFLRQVRWNGVEVVRAVYAAVRDRNWNTVPARVEEFELERAANATRIHFTAVCEERSISYRYQAVILVRDNTVRFELAGEAQSDFLRNRIGLCVLHPIALCAGSECVVEHTDGITEPGRFPKFVRPDQPFKNIRKLRYAVDAHTEVKIAFEGEVFEMEDQRNWTDASFKTYGTPLALPFPEQVRKGDTVKQVVTVAFCESRPSERAPRRRHDVAETIMRMDFASARAKPLIGLGAGAQETRWSPVLVPALRHLNCDHLRIECRFRDADWERKLAIATENAQAIGAGLHIAAFLDADANVQLRALADACLRLRAPVKLWIIFARDHKCTPPRLVMLAQEVLRSTDPNVPFAAGTDANFAELNRDRLPSDANWHPCFSVNPQVHASDEMSMIENVEAQADVVRSSAVFARLPVVLSPITLRPRFNPNATDAVDSLSIYDLRQTSLFAAAWTLGSMATLAREKNVHSITYFEANGPGGALSSEGLLYPVYHLFAVVAELSKVADVSLEAGADGMISAIGGVTGSGQQIIVAANHTGRNQIVKVESAARVRLRRLEATGQATLDPLWWINSPTTICDGRQISLAAGAVVRIELL
jgi:hypothetical protein